MVLFRQGLIDQRLKQKTAGFLIGALLILTAGFWGIDQYQTRQQQISGANTLLQSLLVSLRHSITEDNGQSAERLLKSLVDVPRVRSAALYTGDGTLLTQYLSEENQGPVPVEPGTPGIRLEGSKIKIVYSLKQDEANSPATLFLSLSFADTPYHWQVPFFLILIALAVYGWGYQALYSFLTRLLVNALSHNTPSLASPSSAEHPEKRTRTKLRENTTMDSEPSSSPQMKEEDMKLLQMEERLKLEILIRKQSEDILKTHNRILEYLAMGNSLEEVLDLVNLNLEWEILPDTISTIYLMNEDGTDLFLKSAPRLDESLKPVINTWRVAPQGNPLGLSACNNHIVIVEDIDNDPQGNWLPEEPLANGFKACWSIPIPNPVGKSIGVIGVFCHHSRSPSVEELKNLHSSAFLAGIAITRKHNEDDLKNYSRELARSNQDLDDFATIASHDLQEPLRKVAAFGERLKKHCGEQLDDRGKDYLERMLRGTLRMQQFITDLLKYSRAGARIDAFQPTDLNKVLTNVLVDFEFRIEETGATLQVGTLPTIEADSVQLQQVFANLIGNALKFIREGVPPQINITASMISEHHVEISLVDNGIGFDNNSRDRIFKPLERLNSNRIFEGSGMGLALCRKIVERHSGTITAESQPGKGTRITIDFPLHQKKI